MIYIIYIYLYYYDEIIIIIIIKIIIIIIIIIIITETKVLNGPIAAFDRTVSMVMDKIKNTKLRSGLKQEIIGPDKDQRFGLEAVKLKCILFVNNK